MTKLCKLCRTPIDLYKAKKRFSFEYFSFFNCYYCNLKINFVDSFRKRIALLDKSINFYCETCKRELIGSRKKMHQKSRIHQLILKNRNILEIINDGKKVKCKPCNSTFRKYHLLHHVNTIVHLNNCKD